MLTFNYQDGEISSSPTIIVSGRTSTGIDRGVIQFINSENKVFPPQNFEVNSNGHFKALLHLSAGVPNKLEVKVFANAYLNPFGFPENATNCVDTGSLTLRQFPLPENKLVHLCVILGKDSNGSYDMPRYKLQRGEVANLDTAIQKLKVAGRMMQAFTQDDMRDNRLGNRTWQFDEEPVHGQSIFGYNVNSPTPHNEVKIHVLRSPKTVAQLRDPNLAQQNPDASDNGGLFSHALDLISNSPDIFPQDHFKGLKTAIQCAVLYLDSTWDVSKRLILTHAALGGGTDDIKLAIFGSHGLHSWPSTFAQVSANFLDQTHLSDREVANDCNECGTSWECMNITMGAFMHEIGHLLGCPHQVNGVMLRDYIWFNRSFMTRELECLRTHSRGQIIDGRSGQWPAGKVCHWNRLDIIRFLYHDSFGLPNDKDDSTFQKNQKSTKVADSTYDGNSSSPVPLRTDEGVIMESDAGIYMIEFIIDDLARHSIVYLPRSLGGEGLQKELFMDYDSYYQNFRSGYKDAKPDFKLKVLSIAGDWETNNFREFCNSKSGDSRVRNDFGLNRGQITAYKSSLLGRNENNEPIQIAGFNIKGIHKIRVFSENSLFGLKFFYSNSTGQDQQAQKPPPLPERNYVHKFFKSITPSSNQGTQSTQFDGQELTSSIGHETNRFSDFIVPPGEYITKFNVRCGWWIDAIQFETNRGTKSPIYGGGGGGVSTLKAPSNFTVVGMYGYTGAWMDGLGIFYSNEV